MTAPLRPATSDPRWRLLVVDDDDLVIAALRTALPASWTMTAVSDRDQIPTPTEGFAAALVDMHLTKNLARAEGLEVITELRRAHPHLELIAMSGDLDRHLMERGLKAGASRFLAKPIGPEELGLTLEKVEALLLLRNIAGGSGRGERQRWLGASDASLAVTRKLAQLKGEPGPILIEGESGVGKEVAALVLHAQEAATTPARPFVSVNLAAVPEAVFESEFFGHVKGAFTGADQNKLGLAEAAHGGDLFLDEIEALPLANQAKLLRFLESGEVRRVGARETIRVQVRVLAASNRPLETMVREHEFREDLLWRLKGKTLQLPPLRERLDDIQALAEHFFSLERPRRNKTLGADALEALRAHSWPGNVRELRRVCEQLCLYSPLPVVRAEDVRMCLPKTLASPAGSWPDVAPDLSLGLGDLVARFEASLIREALRVTSDVDTAAERIGISRSSMYKKMKDYDIERA